ncbi:MAG: metallophosphoesterase family protein [Planctomycetaceae bacterium]|nr:metallophosphoesterase family protein [Planctomycetaceae bacterium]
MKRALISDIHANSEALDKVLDDIRQQGVSEIYCLGDIIGYGPNPCECLDQVIEQCTVTILGNHDQAALFDPDGFNPVALQAVYWTRDQLERRDINARLSDARWDFLGELPRSYSDDQFLYVHGSPREPTNEYVFPEDVYNQRKMDALFDRIERYCFQGHTHIPGVFTAGGEFITPDECDFEYRLTGDKAMFNVGSVGQPRDGDPRACYVIVHLDDEPRVEFRRVEYVMETTIQKIYKIPSLDNMLGDRLRSGR